MGEVYKVREAELDRTVALKMLKPSILTLESGRERFIREGKVLSALSHPNLPMFYRFGLWQDTHPYIAMEFIEGSSLRTVLDTQKLSIAQILEIVRQACNGVYSAHKAGVIHRDLKPSNLMLVNDSTTATCLAPKEENDRDKNDDDGGTAHSGVIQTTESVAPFDTVKVVDFGLAGYLGELGAQTLTQTGELLGTIFYMSPEQCLGKSLDQRCDIYSLGCILFECLTGNPPFISGPPIAIVRQHVSDPVPSLPDHYRDEPIPPGLQQVLLKALAKDPADRYHSLDAFANDIQLLEQLRWQEASAVLYPVLQPEANESRKGKPLILVAGFIALAIMVSTIFVLTMNARSRDASSFLVQSKPHALSPSRIPTPLAVIKHAYEILNATRRQNDFDDEEAKALEGELKKTIDVLQQISPKDLKMLYHAHLLIGDIQTTLARHYLRLGDRARGLAECKRARDHTLYAVSCCKKPDHGYYLPAVVAYNHLYDLTEMAGQFDDDTLKMLKASRLLLQTEQPSPAFAMIDDLPGGLSWDERYFNDTKMGRVLFRLNRPDEAEALLRWSIKRALKDYGICRISTCEAMQTLASGLIESKRNREALEMIRWLVGELENDIHRNTASIDRVAECYSMFARSALEAGDLQYATTLTSRCMNYYDEAVRHPYGRTLDLLQALQIIGKARKNSAIVEMSKAWEQHIEHIQTRQ